MTKLAPQPHIGPQTGPIAYLTGEYPRATDTFIQREVLALRGLGMTINTCSIRITAARHHVGEVQRSEHAQTFHVQSAAKNPARLLGAHMGALIRSPGRWLAALQLAWLTSPPGLRARLWQAFYFAEAGVLARHLQENGVVHLHNHSADSSGTVAMLASAMTGIPFSITLHGPAIFYEPKWWRLDEKIARARFVVCISHFCRSQAMLFSDQTHWHKLRIVHCGVTPASYGTVPRKPFLGRVCFVGRLDAVKGVPLLLEAFAAVRYRHPEARLTIVGDGPDRARLEAQMCDLELTEVVCFAGYLDERAVARLLEEVDMLILPSFAEGLPVVLMEAMASRIPVIASRVAGVPELVEDGVSGFLVPPSDLETLIERLDQLLADPGLCARMGAAGRLRVEAEFDIALEARRLHSCLQS